MSNARIAAAPQEEAARAQPIALGRPLSARETEELRRRLIFDYGKFDLQCEDVDVIARAPLLITHNVARWLSTQAEQLAQEALEAEEELARRPELHGLLGLPRRIVRELRWAAERGVRQPGPRVVRFDFHWTAEGWRVSEGNADVPGGFLEAAALPALFSASVPSGVSPGAPAVALAEALRRAAISDAVALVHASGYTDDRQVMLCLGRAFESAGLRAVLLRPDQVLWETDRALALHLGQRVPLGAIVRFYPAEWLASLPRSSGWQRYFRTEAVPQSNPPTALLTQSKRWPLLWDRLAAPLPTWRRLMPENREPGEIAPGDRGEWVFKPALGRAGESVLLQGVSDSAEAALAEHELRRNHRRWIAQRRFAAAGLRAPDGTTCFPCLGVFVIDGRAAGIYGRVAQRPLIDWRARDAAVMVV